MKCKKCGEKNSDSSKFCRKCGNSIGNASRSYSNKKRISLIVLVVVGFLFGLGAIMVWQMGGISAGQEFSITRHGEFSQLDEGFTDVTIRNYEDVICVAEDALDILGIEAENRDLEMLSVYESEDIVFYKVQEYVGDYPVYGRNAVVLVNEEGTVLGFTSNITNYQDLNLEEVPDMDVGAILDSVEQYSEMNDEALLIQYIVNDPQIYTYNDITTMVYFIPLFNEESDISTKEVCVDAYTNQVLFVNDLLYEAESATCYNQDNSISVVGSYEEGTYSLYNSEREITIYSFHGTDSSSEDGAGEVITSENNIFGDTQEEQELNHETAIRLMQNCTLIYDYYEDTYNECPSDEYLFCYDDGYDDGENARGGNLYSNETNSKIGFISVGSKMDISELDLLAHEYTHIVTRENVNWIEIDNYNEPGAINEAYSDILGEVIEAYLTGEEPDWQHSASRNIADPESDGYPVELPDYFTEDVALGVFLYSDFNHGYSTIISHCAYQMYTGVDDQYVKLSIEEIGDLFYYTMFTLPGNCDFQTLYDNLVFVAKLLDFSEDQIKCIEAAFNEAGINGGRLVYSDDTVLSVLDGMRNPVVSYEVEISGQEETFFSTKDYYNTFKSDDDGYVYLDVPDGEYTLTIIIDDYKYVESLTINSKSGYKALTAQTYYIDEYTTIVNTGGTEIDYSQEVEVEETMTTNETIYGLWIVDATKTYEESGMSLQDVFGTSIKLSPGSMEIGEDGSFKFAIGCDGGEGTYTWSNNIVSYEIELYNSGEPTGTVILEDSVENQTYMILNYDIGTETPYKLYFTKEEQLDITTISTEQLVGEWYIDDYTTYYNSGYTLAEIYGNNIGYNEKALRMYQDQTYEYDVDSYGNIESGTYIIDGDRVVFNCENTNGDVELIEMTMVEKSNQLKLIKLHNGSEVLYFQTSNELAETTIQETPVGAYAFDTIDDVIDHVLKDCNAWDEDDGLYVYLDNGSDIMTNEDGSISFVVRYQRSEEELQEFAQAFADSGITSDGTGYTYCMDVEVETANGKYYLKYDDGSYYQGE